MNKYDSKNFKLNNHFVLYNDNENEVYFLDNFNELSKYINLKLKQLVYRFNNDSVDDIINIEINNKKYQLYTFID